jgi:hypothetical protein
MLGSGFDLRRAAEEAARLASEAVRGGFADLGSGDGPVDVFGPKTKRVE